jgi:hypothetical protein
MIGRAWLMGGMTIASASLGVQAGPPPVDPEETFAASELLSDRSTEVAVVTGAIDDDVLEGIAVAGVWTEFGADITSVQSTKGTLVRAVPLGRTARDGVRFVTDAPGAVQVAVQVSDALGRVVYRESSNGSLEWKLLDTSGVRVPRGVYFYTAMVRTANGRIVGTERSRVVVP